MLQQDEPNNSDELSRLRAENLALKSRNKLRPGWVTKLLIGFVMTLVFIAFAIMAAMQDLGSQIDGKFSDISKQLESQ
jgi:Flp pilus assembly pilin Flp